MVYMSFLQNIHVKNLLKHSTVCPNYLRLNFEFIFDFKYAFNIEGIFNNLIQLLRASGSMKYVPMSRVRKHPLRCLLKHSTVCPNYLRLNFEFIFDFKYAFNIEGIFNNLIQLLRASGSMKYVPMSRVRKHPLRCLC